MKTDSGVRIPTAAIVIAVILVVAAAVTAALIVTRDGEPRPDTVVPTAQVASVQVACRQWLADTPDRVGAEGWCEEMSRWMSDTIEPGDMGPHMMWGDADRVRANCRQWLAETPPTPGQGIDSEGWCDGMARWMREHMRDWSGHEHWQNWYRDGAPMRDSLPGG